MNGYPKTLNSKEDYLYVRENFPASNWRSDFENLLSSLRGWFSVKEISSPEEGIVDETHKIVASTEIEDGYEVTKYTQYEYRVNEKCKLLSIGFTEEEVISLLEEERVEDAI